VGELCSGIYRPGNEQTSLGTNRQAWERHKRTLGTSYRTPNRTTEPSRGEMAIPESSRTWERSVQYLNIEDGTAPKIAIPWRTSVSTAGRVSIRCFFREQRESQWNTHWEHSLLDAQPSLLAIPPSCISQGPWHSARGTASGVLPHPHLELQMLGQEMARCPRHTDLLCELP
jgi:hypothetical protein